MNSYTKDAQHNSSVCDGGFVVTWCRTSYFDTSPHYRALSFSQRFDANGNRVGGEFDGSGVGLEIPDVVNKGDVAALSDGGFIVTWGSGDIFAQRFDADGNPVPPGMPLWGITEVPLTIETSLAFSSPSKSRDTAAALNSAVYVFRLRIYPLQVVQK